MGVFAGKQVGMRRSSVGSDEWCLCTLACLCLGSAGHVPWPGMLAEGNNSPVKARRTPAALTPLLSSLPRSQSVQECQRGSSMNNTQQYALPHHHQHTHRPPIHTASQGKTGKLPSTQTMKWTWPALASVDPSDRWLLSAHHGTESHQEKSVCW